MSENLYDPDAGDDEGVPEGLIDFTAISEILLRAKDALRPLGLTLELNPPPPVQLNGKAVVVLLPCIIRPSAKTKLDVDKAGKEAFNKMMAEQADAEVKANLAEMQALAADPQRIQDYIDGKIDDLGLCAHTRRHPSGHCLDCGQGL